ncbi:leucine-rich repeat and IQ domain-containing protein 1 isoform X2 [Peromyscus californicus insignis]|uniref:leucine-rich repeat and IQ domain-containing protein 1 isoform X2 n=1 Tax=Peromyscus californicus insignis TaxID=564181 RepID=UPI0022A7162C|nr:leucine-rich repeat and IQ domain-containing protein 1 isoform X2 [Peromyscus californicus insignis]
MEDNDDSDAKLREEIEAELDKISISSLENNEVENDSESETQSDNSDTDLIELPESVLHCINVIKNKSKTAEELFLQDLEDTDVFSCSYGTVSNNHMHLRTGSAAESKANSEQLMKILSVIEKEEFMRSLTHSARSDSVPEPVIFDTPMDECILSDDADLSFGYFEVEERCRKSFEAWQDKQRELEDKDKETLEAQSDLEKQKFQEDDEKRHCWIKQFEAEKEKLENLQKQDQDKMNDELHKEEKIWKEKYREHEERIRNLHLQMEEERTRLRELQEKEKTRLLNLQHNAAVKIQAIYRGFITYRKYSPIIREQIENKKKKAQERKEKEAKIRQKEEERRRRIEEEQRIEEARKKKMLEERRRREREYEEKKSILRQEREEQRNREKMRPREDARQPLIISCALRKGEGHVKQVAVANVLKNKVAKAEELEDTNSKKQEAVCLVQQSNKRENVRKQLALTEPVGVKLKPSQAMLEESKMNAKNENLPKLKMNENVPKPKMNEKSENLSKKQYSQKLVNQEINLENIDQKYELKNLDLQENVNTQCQGQERKSQTQKEENVDHGTNENVGQETQIMFGFEAAESIGVELKTSQAILTELKMNEKNENLPKLKMNEKSENLPKKQCSEKVVNQEINFESIDQKYELKTSDLKENVDTQCQGQERKTQTQTEENVEQATKADVGQETQIMFGFAATESIGVELKPRQVILAELKMNEKNENLPKFKMNGNVPKLKMDEKSKNLPKKQCSEKLVNQEINLENIDQTNELKNSDLQENVDTQCEGQERKSQTQKEENVDHSTNENVGQETQTMFGFAAAESIGVELKTSQEILTELKMNEKNENLPKLKMNEKSENLPKKQCSEKLVNQEINLENIDQKYELKNSDLKENVDTQCQGQERKTQTQKEENVEHATKANVGQETQIMFGHKQKMSEEDNIGAQAIINDTQERLTEKVEKRDLTEQNRSLYEGNYSSTISMQKDPLPLIFENPAPVERNVMLEDEEIDLKSKRIEEIPKDNVLTCDAVIINSSALVHTEGNTNQQGSVSGKLAPSEEAGRHSANSPLVTEEGDSPKSEIKDIPEQWKQTKAEMDSGLACSLSQVTVSSSVEERRLAWIKSFKPWPEIFEQNQLKEIIKKKRLVKCPANTMPPLDTSAILRHGPWNTLQQVTAITFQDLPGCSLSTLAECTNLQLLSLQRCGLTSLHGLNHCKKLKYIDAQENHIETINCENLENLCVVLLNKNLLTSIHGLDGCTNIKNLELSHNKITRISGLESLKYLQQLTVDHNQLISTKGLCEAPTIIYLDCSHNHLTDIDGIGNCGLLQIVKLQGNYLREPPSLKNHVLLRELHLDDNSILNVEGLSSCWLPLLRDLSLAQNSLTTIVPLFHFVSLEKLDVSNNCLSDLTSVMCWFNACYSLRELCLTGNPVLQEINWRHSILKILPALRILNGDILKPHSDVHIEEHYHQDLGCLLALCQYQLQEFNLLTDKYITQKRDILTLRAADKLCHYYENLMKLSDECRRAHEHGDVNIIKRTEPDTEKKHPAFSNTNSTLQNEGFHSWTDSPDTSENLMDSGSRPSPLNWEEPEGSQEKNIVQKNENSRIGSPTTRRASFREMKIANSDNHQNTEPSETSKAAVLIQAQWRSYVARRQINFSAKTDPTTTEPLHNPFTNNQTTSNEERRKNVTNIQQLREKAALHIQAVWKGFILRKKLAMALEALRNEESGEEYEEIDLEDFEYDEDALEKEWPVLDSTGFPSQTLPSSNQLPWPKNKNSQALKHDETSLPVPTRPAQAWLWNEKENLFSSEQTQLSSRSENRTLSRTPESNTSRKSLLQSEKEEKISEEWGFKDISTAQQMLKRAQKMKSKKLRKNLDPSVRLALFKKNNNEVSVPKPSKKTPLRRDGYFEDEEEDALSKPTTVNEKSERSREYTYQWLHTQVGVPEATSSRTLKCNHFLPELDPDVLNGGRVQLVARLVSREDTDLDLFSMTSGSALSVNREKKSQARRSSSGSSSCSSKKILAPMITNTRPSIKERISFRDNPVRFSGGWGSGKKKAKTST